MELRMKLKMELKSSKGARERAQESSRACSRKQLQASNMKAFSRSHALEGLVRTGANIKVSHTA